MKGVFGKTLATVLLAGCMLVAMAASATAENVITQPIRTFSHGSAVTCVALWKYDVNRDGRINVLDLVLVRNRLLSRCEQEQAIEGEGACGHRPAAHSAAGRARFRALRQRGQRSEAGDRLI